MTSKIFIPQEKLRHLTRRSDCLGLMQLFGHVGTLLATGWLVLLAADTYWVLPVMVVHGIILVFLFSSEHEAIHLTAFRTRFLNWVVAWLAGLLLLLPPAWFRCFHLAHHRWTQDLALDPELISSKPLTLCQYIIWVLGILYWYDRVTYMARNALGRVDDTFVPDRSKVTIIREARIFWVIYAGLFAALAVLPFWRELLLLWFFPVLLGQPFLRLYLLAEHTGRSHVGCMLERSRTTLTLTWVRRLAWNMPYHAEHHAFPGVPFHSLLKLHKTIAPQGTYCARGYIAVNFGLLSNILRRKARG